ncbi:hypothetical protein [Leptospira alstonii]|uniref:hypothetical protein n=1 Tax=Leptospira alstonii TaxID=28452 RepID=UPI00056A98CD|nr:hypothetical protein [Leptospira alstonii]
MRWKLRNQERHQPDEIIPENHNTWKLHFFPFDGGVLCGILTGVLIFISFLDGPIYPESNKRSYQTAADYPYYTQFNPTEDLHIVTRLHTGEQGKYRIVFSASEIIKSRFENLFSLSILGADRREISFKQVSREGHIFLELDFAVDKGQAERNEYVELSIMIKNSGFERLGLVDQKILKFSSIGFGFRKL